MRLGQLLALAGYQNSQHELDGLEIKRVITDSRACQAGTCLSG